MSTPQLHEPLDLGWPWRTLEDAETCVTHLADGRVELRIWHEFLPGITLNMLEWWFQNLDQSGAYQGQEIAYYRLWHPRDHIQIKAERGKDGRIQAGGHIHIQEAFGRNMAYLIHEKPGLHRWDRGGVGLHVNKAGHRIMELDHAFRERSDGVMYESCMRIGASAGPLRRLIDKHMLPREFGPEKAQAWLKHNVEEVGCLPHFLPEIFARST